MWAIGCVNHISRSRNLQPISLPFLVRACIFWESIFPLRQREKFFDAAMLMDMVADRKGRMRSIFNLNRVNSSHFYRFLQSELCDNLAFCRLSGHRDLAT